MYRTYGSTVGTIRVATGIPRDFFSMSFGLLDSKVVGGHPGAYKMTGQGQTLSGHQDGPS